MALLTAWSKEAFADHPAGSSSFAPGVAPNPLGGGAHEIEPHRALAVHLAARRAAV